MSGGGMTMYMDGFSSTLMNRSAPCLNLFFSDFTLDNELKLFLAMIIVVCIGISIEGVASLRRRYISGVKKKIQNDPNNRRKEMKRAKYVLSLYIGLQALIGYILMLSTMTYSIEIIFSAVSGLSLGFFIFGQHTSMLGSFGDGQGDRGGGGSTPCCDFSEDNGGDTDTTFGYVPVNDSDINTSSLHLRKTLDVIEESQSFE
jgi:hypothetical protein